MPDPVDLAVVCAEGSIELEAQEETHRLDQGDSLHAVLEEPFALRNSGDAMARLILFMDPGLSQL
jgi:quercetin dioxygenase-like cupin family protein